MKRLFGLFVFLVATQVINPSVSFSQSEKVYWEPQPDSIYMQEIGNKIVTDTPLLSVVTREDEVFACSADDVFRVTNDQLESIGQPDGKVRSLATAQGRVFVLTESEVLEVEGKSSKQISDAPADEILEHLDSILIRRGSTLTVLSGDPGFAKADPGRGLSHVASYAESLYGLSGKRLVVFDTKRWDWKDAVDWGELYASEFRDMIGIGGRLYIATDQGLGELRGLTLDQIGGGDGLPFTDLTCLAEGFDGDLWIGSTRGAIRRTRGGEFHYFAYQRWLPNDHVNAIATNADSVYVATNGGLGIIRYEPWSLRKKAAFYERHLTEWGQRRLGFVHKLFWNDAKGGWIREISDNDGGWTAEYLAGLCYQYKAEGDPDVRALAVETFDTLKWLEEITPIDGYPARSIWAKGETGHQAQHGSGGLPAEWHDGADGKFEWKADTSSDETGAHFYATAVFHDFVARDEEKARAIEHVERIARHIKNEGWVLRDMDGKPTRWGRWDPEYLQRPYGYYARGLNGMEAMSYMRTAAALSGLAEFEEGFEELIGMGYHRHSLRQKLTFPPDDVVPWDDRLAFMSYFNLLRYEDDPHYRSIFMRSLERSWEIKRNEFSPWYNYMYGALTGNDCETDRAIEHLREWPLDMISYSYDHTHRADLHPEPGYKDYVIHGRRAISPRERGGLRWDSTTLDLQGGSGGRAVTDPSGWLHAYWMGRAFGMIKAPDTDDDQLISVEERGLKLGAVDYDGPAR